MRIIENLHKRLQVSPNTKKEPSTQGKKSLRILELTPFPWCLVLLRFLKSHHVPLDQNRASIAPGSKSIFYSQHQNQFFFKKYQMVQTNTAIITNVMEMKAYGLSAYGRCTFIP